jgi:hypothetical protein
MIGDGATDLEVYTWINVFETSPLTIDILVVIFLSGVGELLSIRTEFTFVMIWLKLYPGLFY